MTNLVHPSVFKTITNHDLGATAHGFARPVGGPISEQPRPNIVTFYIPQALDLSTYPEFQQGGELEGCQMSAYWFIHKIITLQLYYHHSRQNIPVRISRQTRRHFITGKDFKADLLIQAFLRRSKIVSCNGYYIKGLKSKAYRLHNNYVGSLRQVICTDFTLCKKIKAWRITRANIPLTPGKLDRTEAHLLHWLSRISINGPAALAEIDAIGLSPDDKLKVKAQQELAYRKSMMRMPVEELINNRYRFNIDNQGRLHTPITNLWTPLRNHLTIDGKPLINLDIVNSQLIFFLLLLLESYGAHTTNPKRSSVLGVPLGIEELPLDILDFQHRVINGTIYDDLLKEFNSIAEVKINTRKQFKQEFFKTILYGDNYKPYSCNSPLTKLFIAKFPNVWTFIIKQKHAYWKGLSLLMQKRESQFMIGKVCHRLQEHHPDIPVFTIHDSILTTSEHALSVHQLMLDEFKRQGIAPRIRNEGGR